MKPTKQTRKSPRASKRKKFKYSLTSCAYQLAYAATAYEGWYDSKSHGRNQVVRKVRMLAKALAERGL